MLFSIVKRALIILFVYKQVQYCTNFFPIFRLLYILIIIFFGIAS